jgi:predicted adenylyl cyclase CyaB
MHNFEIEIKSLLSSKDQADKLVEKMKDLDPDFKFISSHNQLNHYFTNGNTTLLYSNVVKYFNEETAQKFKNLTETAKDYSVRTRQADGRVIFVFKAAVDDTTSSNGTARLEFESQVKVSLDELDKVIISSGFQYQAKWSRERHMYHFKDLDVSIDKNAGYGYLAEFEKVIDDPANAEKTKSAIRSRIALLGIKELPQDRLERMFKFYNEHWEDYYGTEKTFVIE